MGPGPPSGTRLGGGQSPDIAGRTHPGRRRGHRWTGSAPVEQVGRPIEDFKGRIDTLASRLPGATTRPMSFRKRRVPSPPASRGTPRGLRELQKSDRVPIKPEVIRGMSIKELIMKSSLKGSFHPHRQAAPMVQDRLKRGKGTDWRAIRLSGGCRISPFCLSLALLVIAVPSHAKPPHSSMATVPSILPLTLSI